MSNVLRDCVPTLCGAFAAFAVAACLTTQGNGHLVAEHRDAAGFTGVDNDTSLAVSVVQGPAFSVDLRVDSNLLPLVETTVNHGVLQIRANGSFEPSSGADVVVALPTLDSVRVAGSGDMTLTGAGAKVAMQASGSGSVDATAFAANGADIDVTGSGSIAAVVTGDATLSSEGSGSIDAALNGGTAVFSVSGSGSIRWSGDERVGSVSRTGSGSVEHR